MRRRRAARPFERILVVGAGRAGVAAAEEARRLGFAGELVILHDENGGPYDRPACAKGVLTGHQRPADIGLPVAEGTGITWELGRRAVHLDPIRRIVHTNTGESYGYDGLVIATGSSARPPAGWPIGAPGLHVLYRLADAWALRADLRRANRVAVIGAGLTGCEVASAVRSLARDCVLIDAKPYAMTRALGEHVGRMLTYEMAREGVQLRLGRRVSGLARVGRGWQLRLDDGEEIIADVMVAATGERPDTGWLAGVSGLDTADGVLCDASLRVVGADDVVAAGTVARWPNLRYSSTPTRIGQWIAALEQGRAAARTLLAGDSEVGPVTHVPRFWSDQFGLRIQVCGQLPTDAAISVGRMRPRRTDVARSGVLVGYHVDDQLVGLVAVNASHAFTAMSRAMLATAGHVAPARPGLAPRQPGPAPRQPGPAPGQPGPAPGQPAWTGVPPTGSAGPGSAAVARRLTVVG